MRLNTLRQFNSSGTTSATANQPMLSKKQNYWKTSHIFPFGFCGEGLYFEYLNREGCNFEQTENAYEAGATTENVTINLTSTLSVVCFVDAGDSNKLKAITQTVSGNGTITDGTVRELNATTTNSISGCKVNDTTFVVAYRDDGGSDYLAARICTIAAGVITAGTEQELTAAAINDEGTSIELVKSEHADVLVAGYILTSDSLLYLVADTFITTTFGTAGIAVAVTATATLYPAITSYTLNQVLVAYQAGGVANDPITYICCDVLDTKIVSATGTATSLAGTAAAATYVGAFTCEDGTTVISWIDSTFGNLRACTISDYTATFGDELAVTAAATLTFCAAELSSDRIITAYENDAVSDYGMVTLVTRSGTALTASYQDVFAEAACAYVSLAVIDGDRFLVSYRDEGNSNKGTANMGIIKQNLIDVRSTVASAIFDGYMFHLNKAGLGFFAANKKTGTTNVTANTAMSTQIVLPWNKWIEVAVLFKDRGMYVEDDGTAVPAMSGVSAANRTIDVRSQTTSEAFECFVVKCAGYVRTVTVE